MEPSSSAGEQLATLNETLTASKSSSPVYGTDYSIPLPSSGTFKNFSREGRPKAIGALRTWLQRAFPAPSFPKQPGAETLPTTCGQKPRKSFAWYVPAYASWRTSRQSGTSTEGLPKFSQTWPRSGMTQGGTAYLLVPSEPRTIAPAFGFWLATPTATANQAAPSMQKHPGCRAWNGRVDPESFEWAMGWPIGWTALEPLETDKFQQWCELHGISWEGTR